jgi:hypothetical protein
MMSREGAPKVFHRLHLHIQLRDFLAQQIAHLSAFVSATRSKKSLDLVKRKAQLLSLLDKSNALD